MQKILELNNKSNQVIKNIKKDIINLLDNYTLKSNNVKKMETTIKKLHNVIGKLENIVPINKKFQKSIKNHNEDEIKKKIIVSKKNKSFNFRNWLFNNNEL